MRDIKETVCRVPEYAVDSRAAMSSWPAASYELPDGRTIDVGGDRFAVPELLFQPTLFDTSAVVRKTRMLLSFILFEIECNGMCVHLVRVHCLAFS